VLAMILVLDPDPEGPRLALWGGRPCRPTGAKTRQRLSLVKFFTNGLALCNGSCFYKWFTLLLSPVLPEPGEVG
jgi:hypothetical protein